MRESKRYVNIGYVKPINVRVDTGELSRKRRFERTCWWTRIVGTLHQKDWYVMEGF